MHALHLFVTLILKTRDFEVTTPTLEVIMLVVTSQCNLFENDQEFHYYWRA